MCTCIESIFKLAMGSFGKAIPKEIAEKNLELLIAQTDKLRSSDVGLESSLVFRPWQSENKKRGPPPVTYIPVAKNKHISMGIFVIREGQNIPLHDHPNMHGLIKCIKGKLKITSYSKLESNSGVTTPDSFRRSASLVKKLRFGELFVAQMSSVTTVTPDSSPCLLSPSESNIHTIESVGGPAAFLDILAPPYNNQEKRDCHYFRVLSEPVVEDSPGLHWLMMCDSPASFYCPTEKYHGPTISDSDSLLQPRLRHVEGMCMTCHRMGS